jgi:hypothetical protein
MAHLYIKEVLFLFTTWIVYGKVKVWLDDRKLKKWGDENGCEAVPVVPNKLPYGLERLWFIVTKAKGNNTLSIAQYTA